MTLVSQHFLATYNPYDLCISTIKITSAMASKTRSTFNPSKSTSPIYHRFLSSLAQIIAKPLATLFLLQESLPWKVKHKRLITYSQSRVGISSWTVLTALCSALLRDWSCLFIEIKVSSTVRHTFIIINAQISLRLTLNYTPAGHAYSRFQARHNSVSWCLPRTGNRLWILLWRLISYGKKVTTWVSFILTICCSGL